MTEPLMPKATAVWLIDNTTLSFDQIAEFCGMHPLEIQGIADGEVAVGIIGQDPVVAQQLSRQEIERCEQDPEASLKLDADTKKYLTQKRKVKGGKYTPVARRQDKPDAIAWLIKNVPGVTDAQIAKLIGTTKNTITAVRTRTHWNTSNIRPRDPVLLGLCTQTELDNAAFKAKVATEKAQKDEPSAEAS